MLHALLISCSLIDIFKLYLAESEVMILLITQFSPASYHSIPLRSKHPPQHPVLKHLKALFLLNCQRPSSAHI
jgi:hypothetical protein